MAIKIGGIDNPTAVKFVNGGVTTNLSEVWYKSSPSATAVKVWPDKAPGLLVVSGCYNGSAGGIMSEFNYGAAGGYYYSYANKKDFYTSWYKVPDTPIYAGHDLVWSDQYGWVDGPGNTGLYVCLVDDDTPFTPIDRFNYNNGKPKMLESFPAGDSILANGAIPTRSTGHPQAAWAIYENGKLKDSGTNLSTNGHYFMNYEIDTDGLKSAIFTHGWKGDNGTMRLAG